MDTSNIKVGNIYKVEVNEKFYDGTLKKTHIGIIYEITRLNGGEIVYRICKENGELLSFYDKNIKSYSFCKTISPEQRELLKAFYKNYKDKETENEKFRKVQDEHIKKIINFDASENNLLEKLSSLSPTLPTDTFCNLLEKTMQEKISSNISLERWPNQFPGEISLADSRDIEKYASPEEYSFIYREYDGCCYINYSSDKLKSFAERTAPKTISSLANISKKVEKSACLGDKNWLSAETIYVIDIKSGTKTELEKIINSL